MLQYHCSVVFHVFTKIENHSAGMDFSYFEKEHHLVGTLFIQLKIILLCNYSYYQLPNLA